MCNDCGSTYGPFLYFEEEDAAEGYVLVVCDDAQSCQYRQLDQRESLKV